MADAVTVKAIVQLQQWFEAQCDGDWEHGHGVAVSTIDNPGWSIDIDLSGTALENTPFASIEIDRAQGDWVHSSKSGRVWKGRGGPKNLEEMVLLFLEWAEI